MSDAREEYTRGFRSTPGIVSKTGVYLPGASGWYPLVGRALMTFTLTVAQPATWRVVSEGAGTSRDADGRARWASTDPVDQIHIVGGPLQVTTQAAGAAQAQVYLHDADAALSSKYLAATAQYLEMYRGLIGPYPYQKFALVENFWETGYGMPSFTLLGPQIIRFPFILTSSYPHEILHNWWGNSVFVEEARGNWSEGLTAYLADHLMQEQRGEDAVYRRSTLQKYRDYVSSAQDFPLVQFRGRHSAATEAIGYGRTMMGFHALRRAVGDETFRKFLARFYRDFKGKRASFDDVRRTMEAVSGQDHGAVLRRLDRTCRRARACGEGRDRDERRTPDAERGRGDRSRRGQAPTSSKARSGRRSRARRSRWTCPSSCKRRGSRSTPGYR